MLATCLKPWSQAYVAGCLINALDQLATKALVIQEAVDSIHNFLRSHRIPDKLMKEHDLLEVLCILWRKWQCTAMHSAVHMLPAHVAGFRMYSFMIHS